ncbi:MAG: hypothetical protein J7623_16460 [Chitinophaga sp.]|uniref:DUF2268 domain-containing putative Zn-dependent protease n=1 Tax=Chitinophaga sp. TaxID=1869181 RepID=UPI001B1D3379|nr:DUF2268 domain-containing putative Zn-dependent protease [Chitinophaga sp.]MBO9730234.1 hypothetical protein [Chitinophaga sp.]
MFFNQKKSVFVIALICSLTSAITGRGQNSANIFTSDIDHFWEAFDSVQTVKDSVQQVAVMQRLYIDKGTEGLKHFMVLRNFNAARLVVAINKYPKFWASIRNSTLSIKGQLPAIEANLQKFDALYPEHRQGKIFFTITAVRAAGTVKDSIMLIGSEIATGNIHTDISEFPDKRLANFFKTKTSDNIVPVVIHEYVHTQQKGNAKKLLEQAICEGACDFIAELVLDTPLTNSYLEYGRQHEAELKPQFQKEMMGEDWSNWLYNGAVTKTMGDLGYFMGYSICKSYYQEAENKSQAIKDILRLDYGDGAAVLKFLKDSRYY